eukprot:14951891-Ditylum_brightwellii.AAC.1
MNVNFPYASNYTEKGFSFHFPTHLHASFALYQQQLVPSGRFLRSWSGKSSNCPQNMGHNYPKSHFCRMINKVGLEENSLMTHFGKQSGAVALAGAGISIPNLKRADRWALISTMVQCMEHSPASKAE